MFRRTLLTLEESRLALADADAEGRQAVTAAAAAELVQERHDEPRAAHPERVAERDRAAVHVHALRIEAELANDDEALRRERLIQLDQVDVAYPDPRGVEELDLWRGQTVWVRPQRERVFTT